MFMPKTGYAKTPYDPIHPSAPGYRERRPVDQLLWCLEYAGPSLQHRMDTARVCAALSIPPIIFA